MQTMKELSKKGRKRHPVQCHRHNLTHPPNHRHHILSHSLTFTNPKLPRHTGTTPTPTQMAHKGKQHSLPHTNILTYFLHTYKQYQYRVSCMWKGGKANLIVKIGEGRFELGDLKVDTTLALFQGSPIRLDALIHCLQQCSSHGSAPNTDRSFLLSSNVFHKISSLPHLLTQPEGQPLPQEQLHRIVCSAALGKELCGGHGHLFGGYLPLDFCSHMENMGGQMQSSYSQNAKTKTQRKARENAARSITNSSPIPEARHSPCLTKDT